MILLLTSFSGFTQQITITTEQAKEAIRNAQRVESLSGELVVVGLQVAQYKELTGTLEGELSNVRLINSLLEENYNVLEAQYNALKERKDPKYGFGAFLRDLGKIGLGVVIGVVGVLVI